MRGAGAQRFTSTRIPPRARVKSPQRFLQNTSSALRTATVRSVATAATPLSATAALACTAVTSGALSASCTFTAYGGLGNDALQGGSGDDVLTGDEGNDTFFTASNADTVDYSARSANLSLTIAPTSAPDANDGASGEGDDLTSTIENLCGSNRASACFVTALLDYNGDGRTDFLSNYTCGYCSSIHYVGIGTP